MSPEVFLDGNLRRLLVVLFVGIAFLAWSDFLQAFGQRFLDKCLALRGKSLARFGIFRAIKVFPSIDPGLLDMRVV